MIFITDRHTTRMTSISVRRESMYLGVIREEAERRRNEILVIRMGNGQLGFCYHHCSVSKQEAKKGVMMFFYTSSGVIPEPNGLVRRGCEHK